MSTLLFADYHAAGFPDAVFGHHSADAGGGVDVGAAADDGAGIQDAVAAHFHEIAQHGAELFKACFDLFVTVLDHHQRLV